MEKDKKFTATFYDNEEAMYARNGSAINWVKQSIGTWLLSILNCNFDDLEEIIRPYYVKMPNDPFLLNEGYMIVSPPTEAEYKNITSQYPFLASYCLEDWQQLFLEFFPAEDERPLRDVIHDIKSFIEIAGSHPEYFNHAFLSRYIINGVMQSDMSWICEEYHSDFPLSDETYDSMVNKSMTECLEISYKHFCSCDDRSTLRYKYHIDKHRIEGTVYSSIFEIARIGKTIKKCKNCGKFFLPENRSDTIYCNNPSPANPLMTCKEYGSQRLWYEKQKDDEVATLSRNILSAKSMLAKRNKDIKDYQASYDYFRSERIKWKKDVESGTKTREEYRKWLLYMQSQKRIKEAFE